MADLLMLEQFYTKEENTVLFGLYQILCAESEKNNCYHTYGDLAKMFNQRKSSGDRKRTTK